MKATVAYENGEIVKDFGSTKKFKVYNIEDGKVVSCLVVGINGTGHEALTGFLKHYTIDAFICGDIGEEEKAVLEEKGVRLCSGMSGKADKAVNEII